MKLGCQKDQSLKIEQYDLPHFMQSHLIKNENMTKDRILQVNVVRIVGRLKIPSKVKVTESDAGREENGHCHLVDHKNRL